MAVPFTQIPDALLVPGMFQEVDPSLAGGSGDIKRALIVACKSDAGTAPAGKPVRALSEGRASALLGAGSPAAILARAFLSVNRVEECWVLPVDAPAAATPWRSEFSVEADSARQGAVAITVCGARIDAAAVAPGASAGEIAAAIVARINAEMWLPVEAAGGLDGTFSVSATVPGSWGNAISVSIESEAPGVSVGSVSESRGSQAANIEPLLKKLGNVRYNYIVSDFSEQANVVALATELTDRFSALRQIGGRAFVAITGDKETMLGKAATVNNPHICLVPRGENPQLPGEWAARWCAAACRVLADDPAANTNGLAVPRLSQHHQLKEKSPLFPYNGEGGHEHIESLPTNRGAVRGDPRGGDKRGRAEQGRPVELDARAKDAAA